MKLWPVEHFCLTFFPDQCKSVQLVRVSFFRSDFLQNPYFSDLHLLFQILNSSPETELNHIQKLQTFDPSSFLFRQGLCIVYNQVKSHIFFKMSLRENQSRF